MPQLPFIRDEPRIIRRLELKTRITHTLLKPRIAGQVADAARRSGAVVRRVVIRRKVQRTRVVVGPVLVVQIVAVVRYVVQVIAEFDRMVAIDPRDRINELLPPLIRVSSTIQKRRLAETKPVTRRRNVDLRRTPVNILRQTLLKGRRRRSKFRLGIPPILIARL